MRRHSEQSRHLSELIRAGTSMTGRDASMHASQPSDQTLRSTRIVLGTRIVVYIKVQAGIVPAIPVWNLYT